MDETNKDAWPPEHAEWIEQVLRERRALIADSGEDSPPVLHLRVLATGRVESANLEQLGHKDLAVALMRQLAEAMKPDAALLIMEAWTLKKEMVANYKALSEQYGEIRNIPGAIEVLVATLETYDASWIGTAEIERKGKAKRCGPMEVQQGDASGGRLANWLPAR